jgi:CheY-like chemotaxis protein
MCGWAEPHSQESVEMIVRQGLAAPSRVEFKFFFWTTDFLEAARRSRFNLFILWLNPGCFSRKDTVKQPLGRAMNWDDHGNEIDAYDFITGLKREFNRPVVAVSNCLKYESKTELEEAGADAVFWMPFGIDEFLSALSRCLKTPRRGVEKKDSPAKPVFTVLIGHRNGIGDGWELMVKQKLQTRYDLRFFRFGDDGGFYPGPDNRYRTKFLELVARESFDLILVYSHMGWGEIELFAGLRAQYGKPIIATSGLTNAERDERLKAAGIMVLPFPYSMEEFMKVLDACLEPERPAASSCESVIPSRKTRPLRIVMVNDENGVLESFGTILRWWFKDATILSFNNGAEALKELSQTEPDLLITDDRMPVMHGSELCERLLEWEVTYPIIVDSAWEPTEQWVREFADQGLNVFFLPLPFLIENLRKVLETAGLKISTGNP